MDIPVRWKCPHCQRVHLERVPGTAADLMGFILRCPDCATESPLRDSVQEVLPEEEKRRPAET